MHFTDQVLTYRPHFSLHPRLTSCILAKKPEMSPHSALHMADRDAGVSTVHLPLVLGLPRWHLQKPTLLLHALLTLPTPGPASTSFHTRVPGKTHHLRKTPWRHHDREAHFLTARSTPPTATTAPRSATLTDMRLVWPMTLLLLLHSLINGAHPYLSLVNLINLCYKLPIELPSSQTQMGVKPIHLLFITYSTSICVLLVTQN